MASSYSDLMSVLDQPGLSSTGSTPDELMSKLDQLEPPNPAVSPTSTRPTPQSVLAKLDQLPISQQQTNTSRTTVEGRPKAAVEAQIAGERKAGSELDTTLRIDAADRDRRTTEAAGVLSENADAQRKAAVAEEQRAAKIAEETAKEVSKLEAEDDGVVDPDRYVRSLGTGQKIGLTLLAGLSGAFGAGLGQKSGVVEMLDKRIEQDIASQEDQIRSGRVRRGNRIAAMRARGASAEQARVAARSQMWGNVTELANIKAKQLGLQGEQLASANKTIAEMNVQREARRNELIASTEAKKQTTVNTMIERKEPKAAGAGKDLELIKKLYEVDAAMEKSGSTPEQRKALFDAAGVPFPAGKSAAEFERGKMNEDQAKAESAANTVRAFGKAQGLTRDPDTGQWRVPGGVTGKLNLPRRVEGLASKVGFADPIASASAAGRQALGRLASGGVISDDEKPQFEEMFGEGMSLDQIATRLNALETFIDPRRSQAADRREQGPIPYPKVAK